jgi:hypothetical protein
MRELTRSVTSFSWAMTLFGVEQMANLASPRRAADVFLEVTRSAERALGPGMRSAFQIGDRLQRAALDVSFDLVSPGRPANARGTAPATVTGTGTNRTSGATAGTSGLLSQAGNLAFELLQLGLDTVYWLSGAAWQQQQGQPGWGPMPPPGAGTQG